MYSHAVLLKDIISIYNSKLHLTHFFKIAVTYITTSLIKHNIITKQPILLKLKIVANMKTFGNFHINLVLYTNTFSTIIFHFKTHSSYYLVFTPFVSLSSCFYLCFKDFSLLQQWHHVLVHNSLPHSKSKHGSICKTTIEPIV